MGGLHSNQFTNSTGQEKKKTLLTVWTTWLAEDVQMLGRCAQLLSCFPPRLFSWPADSGLPPLFRRRHVFPARSGVECVGHQDVRACAGSLLEGF